MEIESPIKPADLRGILKYVPMFRGQTFVISVDGSVVAHENFRNVLMDLAVLRSLNIRIVFIHGVGQQIRTLAEAQGKSIGDPYGTSPTDAHTLKLAIEATGEVSNAILSRFTELGISCAMSNAVRATEVGVIKGVDYLLTGKVDRIDTVFLGKLLDDGVLPLLTPLAATREGQLLRVNSDNIAAEVACALKASKLIFLTSYAGLQIEDKPLLNVPAEELKDLLEKDANRLPDTLQSKAKACLLALSKETPRAHILDGRIFGALLTEVFDKVGLGTMIHSNEYEKIRPAVPEDIHSLYNLIRNAASSDALRERTEEHLKSELNQFFVYEIDGSLIACAALLSYPDSKAMELAAVYVQPFYQGRGVGLKMVRYAEREAKSQGAEKLYALSTQSFPFFHKVCGFDVVGVEDLPPERRKVYEKESRNSRISVKKLS